MTGGPRPRLRRVGERQSGGVDDPVVPDQRDGHLGGLPHPLPPASELGDVRYDAEHAFLTPVHRLRLHVSKPDLQVGGETLARQLQHGHVAAAVKIKGVDEGHGRDRAPDGSHPLVERVLNLVRGDYRPVGAVVQHLLIRLLGTGSGLGKI